MDIKIRNKFTEVKYCVSYGLVIFITDIALAVQIFLNKTV